MLDIQSKAEVSLLKGNHSEVLGHTVQTLERILNVCKSSWLTCIEVKWDVDIYYRTIAAKFTPQILRPEHRKYKCDSADHQGLISAYMTYYKQLD